MAKENKINNAEVPQNGRYALVYLSGNKIFLAAEDGLFNFLDNKFIPVPVDKDAHERAPHGAKHNQVVATFVQAIGKMKEQKWKLLGNVFSAEHMRLCQALEHSGYRPGEPESVPPVID